MNQPALAKPAASAAPTAERSYTRQPVVEVRDTPEAVLLFADMPGVGQDGVEVTVHQDVLILHGRVEDEGHGAFEPSQLEYQPGDFERSFTLPSSIDTSGIKASVKLGVVCVTLPKAKSARPQRIAVSGS